MSVPSLAYTVHPGRGPYLAMLHGFLSSSTQWQQNLAALGEVCQPVTIDLWGHGDSPAPAEQHHYTPATYINQLEAIRLQLNAPQWFLCGYSLGAGISIRYSHTYPDHVVAHLFTNSTSGFADQAQITHWQKDAVESAERIINGGHAAIERIAVHPRFAKRLPEHIRQALVADAANLSPQGVANAMRATTPNVSIRDIAPDNPRPALLCYGALEKRFSPHKEWASENMHNLTVASLDAGHAVNMEDARGFNQVACDFIRQHSS